MAKKLKYWNGRGHGRYINKHISVAAYSQKEAAELVGKACNTHISVSEIRVYYSNKWGNNMEGIKPQAPGVWIAEKFGYSTPKQII